MPIHSPDSPSPLAPPTTPMRRFDPLSLSVFAALLAVLALLASGLGGRAVTSVTDAVGLSSAGQASSAMLSTAGSSTAASSGGTGSHAAASTGKEISVMIENYAYSPATLSVKAGDTVTWTNMDTAAHTVTSSSGPEKLDSPILNKGDSWSYTFTKAGIVNYYCAVHPDMKASVTVSGSSESSSGGHGGSTPGQSSTCDPSLASSVADPFWTHVKKGHLESSPGQQAADILNADQYAKTHTSLFDAMLTPYMAMLLGTC